MADELHMAEKWWFSLSKQHKYNVAGSKSCCDNPENWWSALDNEGKILIWKTCGSCTW